MRTKRRRALSLLLAALTLCLTTLPAAAESATAATMQLMKTEGTVAVTNSSSRSLTVRDNMRLYNGYHVETDAESYAWINLDDAKLTKLDAISEAEVRKSGRELELLLNKGSLYFNVTSPLEDEETLNIRTSTMAVGVRGTNGWVKVLDRWTTEVYILEGTVEVSVTDPVTSQVKTAILHAGDKAVAVAYPQDRAGDKCDIIMDRFAAGDIDSFVLAELVQDPNLCADIYEDSGIDVRNITEETARDRLERDQQAMREMLDRIEEELARQENNVSTNPVWDSRPGTTRQPSFTRGGVSRGTGSPGSQTESDIVLTMPQSATVVQNYLNRNSVKKVTLLASGNEAYDTLDVDIAMDVPGSKTLVLSNGVDIRVGNGFSLAVNGTLTGTDENTLMNYGTVTVNSSDSLKMPFIANNGVLRNTSDGRIVTEVLATNNQLESSGVIEGRVVQINGTAVISGGTVTNGYLVDASYGSPSLVLSGGMVTAENGAALTANGGTISFDGTVLRAKQPDVISGVGTPAGYTLDGPDAGGCYTLSKQ